MVHRSPVRAGPHVGRPSLVARVHRGEEVDTPGVRVDSSDHQTTRCSSYTVVVTHNLGISYPQVGTIPSCAACRRQLPRAFVGLPIGRESGKGCRRCVVRTAGILTHAWWTPGRPTTVP